MGKKLIIELTDIKIKYMLTSQSKGKVRVEDIYENLYKEGLEKMQEEGSREKSLISKIVKIIQEDIKEKKWEKHPRTLLYSMEEIEHQTYEMPSMDEDELRESLLIKLQSERNLDPLKEDIVFSNIGAKGEKGLDTIYVQKYKKSLGTDLAPLKLKGLDFPIFALNRLQSEYILPNENIMFIITLPGEVIVSIYHNGSLSLYRKVETGKNDLVGELMENLSITEKESKEIIKQYGHVDSRKIEEIIASGEERGDLIAASYNNVLIKVERKILQYIDYYQFKHSGETIERIYYTGVYSRIEELKDYIKGTLYIENIAEYGNRDILVGEDELLEKSRNYKVALGTALSKYGSVDFRRVSKIYKKFGRNPIYIGIALIFLITLTFRYGGIKIEEIKERKYLEEVQKNYKIVEREGNELKKIETETKEIEKERRDLSSITEEGKELGDFLKDLSEITPREIYLTNLSYDEKKVQLVGVSTSSVEPSEIYINRLVRDLETIAKDVKLNSTSKVDGSDSVTSFNISVAIDGGEEVDEK